jgi:hypothetical protein
MEPVDQNSYWSSVILASLIFGVVYFALTIGTGYYVINHQPTSAAMSPSSIIGTVVCLFAGFGGMLAVWHHINEYGVTIQMGRGAVIGIITGLLIGIISFVLVHLWEYIDPNYTSRLMDVQIAIMNSKGNLTSEQQQKMADMMHNRGAMFQVLGALFTTIGLGILNLITGIIGTKIFKGDETATVE